MSYIKHFDDIDKLVHNDTYIINNGTTNIVFIGGCRTYALSIYLKECFDLIPYFRHAQYGIAVIGVHIIDLHKRNKTTNMINVIQNADIIICEHIKHYSFLNTLSLCEKNIYNNFNIKSNCKVILIPNLELKFYINELSCNIQDKNEIISHKNENLKKFLLNLKNCNADELCDFIENNIYKIRLFCTFNHPTFILLIYTCKFIFKKTFNYVLPDDILNKLNKIKIFDNNNNTQLVELDYELGIDRCVK